MTHYKILSAVDKDHQDKNSEDILGMFVDPYGICRTCDKDHRYRPRFENTPTSIDYRHYPATATHPTNVGATT